MEAPHQLGRFISSIASDERLKPTHVALYVALCHAWVTNRFQQCYNVSRRQLMMLSRIRSKTTYHKTISELIEMGYIRYRPSYHPVKGSSVTLLERQFFYNKLSRFENLIEKNSRAKNNAVHISLNFDVSEKLNGERRHEGLTL